MTVQTGLISAPAASTGSFLFPENYMGSTQIIYCPAGEPSNYSTGTNFSTALAALTADVRAQLLDQEWPNTATYLWKRAPLGIALQPGKRYRITSGWDLTMLKCLGLHIYGN